MHERWASNCEEALHRIPFLRIGDLMDGESRDETRNAQSRERRGARDTKS